MTYTACHTTMIHCTIDSHNKLIKISSIVATIFSITAIVIFYISLSTSALAATLLSFSFFFYGLMSTSTIVQKIIILFMENNRLL